MKRPVTGGSGIETPKFQSSILDLGYFLSSTPVSVDCAMGSQNRLYLHDEEGFIAPLVSSEGIQGLEVGVVNVS